MLRTPPGAESQASSNAHSALCWRSSSTKKPPEATSEVKHGTNVRKGKEMRRI